MTRRLEFDVFGKIISAERTDTGWRLFVLGAEGKRSPADVVVPDFVTEHELAQYLDDIFHEWASPDRPCVKRISN
jgi:hypothetical protein